LSCYERKGGSILLIGLKMKRSPAAGPAYKTAFWDAAGKCWLKTKRLVSRSKTCRGHCGVLFEG